MRLTAKKKWSREAWLAVGIMACAALCLLLGLGEQQSAHTQEEIRLARVLSAMEGAGTVETAIFYTAGEEDSAVPCGAVIVAQGADDVAVRLRLIRAACTLLGLEDKQVEVFQREGGR